jgi:hypothetical protein
LGGGWAAYAFAGLLLDPLYPVVALFCFVTVVTFYIYRYSEQQRSRIKTVFASEPAVPLPSKVPDAAA